MREALDTVSKVWGCSLEAKWSHCEGRGSLPWDITFFWRVCSAGKAPAGVSFKLSSAGFMLLPWSQAAFSFCLAPSFVLWWMFSWRSYLPSGSCSWNVPPPDADLLFAGVRTQRTESHGEPPFHSVQCPVCPSAALRRPEGKGSWSSCFCSSTTLAKSTSSFLPHDAHLE